VEAIRLRQALRADLDAVVAIWVDAFAADPYFRWIAAGDDAYRAFAADWLAMIAGLAFERGHTYLDPAVTVAVAWIPPDLPLVSPADLERVKGILARHAGPARSEDAFATILAARAHGIEQPYWTLQYIGVRAAAQDGGWVSPRWHRCWRGSTTTASRAAWCRAIRVTCRSTRVSVSRWRPRCRRPTARRRCGRCTG